MDFPMLVDGISMELPILYFKGSQVKISKLHMYGKKLHMYGKIW